MKTWSIPSSTNRFAVARPMPVDPPVTTAIFPENFFDITHSLFSSSLFFFRLQSQQMFERMIRCLVIFNHNDGPQASASTTEITNAMPETWAHRLLHSPRGHTVGDRRPSRHEVNAAPSDHIAAPSRTTSFSRNCPTAPERAGKPPRLGSHPGVESKNESEVSNIRTPTTLPIAHAFRDPGQKAHSIAMGLSPRHYPSPDCRTVHTRYIQPHNGLCATSGSMPCASYPVNFIMPIQPMTIANPY